MYSESPFEKAVTNRDSKALLSHTKTEGMVPQSFWTFSNATSAVDPGSLVYLAKQKTDGANIIVNDREKEPNNLSAAADRCAQNPFLPGCLAVSRRLTENNKATQNKWKYKHSLGSLNGGRNSNSQAKERRSNTSTSSCGSLTKSNKTIRKNRPKIMMKVRRQESQSSTGS